MDRVSEAEVWVSSAVYRPLFLERSHSGLSHIGRTLFTCIRLRFSAFSALFCYRFCVSQLTFHVPQFRVPCSASHDSAFHVPRSVFRVPCSAFHVLCFDPGFRFDRFRLHSILPQTQPHFHLFSFWSSLRLLLLEADSSELPMTLDESRSLFPHSLPHFLVRSIPDCTLYKALGTL